MSKHSKSESKKDQPSEVTETDLDRVQGGAANTEQSASAYTSELAKRGFNPQPEPPAHILNNIGSKTR